MSKHNYQAHYISGIDANDSNTIPDTKPTHPVDTLEPLERSTDYLRGLAVGMRLNQRCLDWLLSSKTEHQIYNRAIALAFPLNLDEWTCSASVEQAGIMHSINRQFLHKLVAQATAIVEDDPDNPRHRASDCPPSDRYQPIPRDEQQDEEDDNEQLDMFTTDQDNAKG